MPIVRGLLAKNCPRFDDVSHPVGPGGDHAMRLRRVHRLREIESSRPADPAHRDTQFLERRRLVLKSVVFGCYWLLMC